jgi:hypothetical protein
MDLKNKLVSLLPSEVKKWTQHNKQ